MIQLMDFSIGYDEKVLLSNVNTSFKEGTLTALIGRNGTGKSTLLKAICGLNNLYQGKIFIKNDDIRKIPRNRLASLLAYVNTQRPRMSNLKCEEVVALGRTPFLGWRGKISLSDKEIIYNAIQQVGMKEYQHRNLNSLSDGECQKIMIARAIAQDTQIIILDEPTSFLDLPTRYELITLLKRLSQNGKTIIFSTHEIDIAFKFSDNIALVESPDLINLPNSEMQDFLKSSSHPFHTFF